ncbi:hypothetical protein B0I35DRAFT_407286 [Stachybotrys elegans]|uniref:Uncharacterized protein n=1 Tax=Stachybotrys elegans TaxID=80388 RepID=A0A8K0WTI8_9HYPO|nr:hypothetical protein B0I35DRAFT_407286 [Stachybotrys elegans]
MTTAQQPNVDDLLHDVELQREQLLRSLCTLHESLSIHRRDRADSRTTAPETYSPPLRAATTISVSTSPDTRRRRATLDVGERPSHFPSPRLHGSDGAVAEEDLSFIPPLDGGRSVDDIAPRCQQTLSTLRFTDDMLLSLLRNEDLSAEVTSVLEHVLRQRADIDLAVPFRDFAAQEREAYAKMTFEVYDVARDAVPTKRSVDGDLPGPFGYPGDDAENPDGIVDAATVWETVKDVNVDGESVGRITIVQEPTPLTLAALHLTMSPHFDMPELLGHLISDKNNRGRTHAFMHRAFEASSHTQALDSSSTLSPIASPDPYLRQRSFFFVFKYYTVSGEGLAPAAWQRFDQRPAAEMHVDHVDIAECGSVLALSLAGEPTKPLWMRPRRGRAKQGFLFDTFGPWHVLSIQSFPDNEHTVRGDEFQRKSFYNGPYAFLELLAAEYRDAGKRNQILHERITKLITPPCVDDMQAEFMFDRWVRDKLLFEDKHFTYIRRYFWAYNTLAVINTGIKAMISAYVDTFTDAFWDGSHPLLWPHPAPESREGVAYRSKMALLRRELDKVISELGEVLKRNERTRKEIENLRDQLFSGSSIKESRRAIDQGNNIRVLTMISMIFLPLTFVTSVFGITEFTISATDWRFALTMVLVCVPFMIIVALFQTRTFHVLVRKSHSLVESALSRVWNPAVPESRAASHNRNRVRLGGWIAWPWTNRRTTEDAEKA